MGSSLEVKYRESNSYNYQIFKVPAPILFEETNFGDDYVMNFDVTDDLAFSHLSLFTKDCEEWNSDWLYIGYYSMHPKKDIPAFSICVNDEGVEKPEFANMILVNSPIAAECLFVEMQKIKAEIQGWYYSMRSLIDQGGTMQAMVNISENHLKNYVAVSDSTFKLLANTKNIDIDDPICVRLIQNGMHTGETLKLFENQKVSECWKHPFYINTTREISPYTLMGRIFQYEDTYFTHAVMTCNNYEATPAIIARYKIFLEQLGELVGEAWHKVESFTHVYDAFIINILEGNLRDKNVIRQRSQYVGINYEGNYVLGGVETTASCDYSVAHMAHEFSAGFPRSKVLIYKDSILFLISLDDGDVKEKISELSKKLEEFGKKYGVKLLLSARFKDVSMCRIALNQLKALRTMLATMAYNPCGLEEYCIDHNCVRVGNKTVYFYDDYYEYCVLGLTELNLEASSYSRFFNALRTLYAYDLKNKMNNLQLLRVYINTERSLIKTGELMHMHRNNVAYRIKKIAELLADIDLDDCEHRYKLLQAYKIYDINHGILTDDKCV